MLFWDKSSVLSTRGEHGKIIHKSETLHAVIWQAVEWESTERGVRQIRRKPTHQQSNLAYVQKMRMNPGKRSVTLTDIQREGQKALWTFAVLSVLKSTGFILRLGVVFITTLK